MVRFWNPQSAKIGAQNPASQNRRYELTVGDVMHVSARRCSSTPPIAWRPILPGIRGSSPSGMNMFSSPCHSEMLWWQPFAETPMNGFGMKHANASISRPTWRQICRYVVSRSAVSSALSNYEVQLELARRVLVVALDHVQAHRLAVLHHLVDDRLELGELVDVVAVRLRLALDRRRAVGVHLEPHHLGLGARPQVQARSPR